MKFCVILEMESLPILDLEGSILRDFGNGEFIDV